MDVELDIRRLRSRAYRVRGASLELVAGALSDRECWGRFNANPTFSLRPARSGDAIDRIMLTLAPSIQMPNWVDRRTAPPAEQQEWDRMYAALERHENAHVSVMRDKAERFRDQVPDISMPMTEAEVRRMLEDFFNDMQRTQDTFDSRSQNGRREGVELVQP